MAAAVARRAPAVGAAAGLLLAAAFTTAMFGVSRLARAEVRDSLRAAEPGRVLVDLVLTPNPSSPACWAVVAIERRPGADALTLRRGTFSFAPSWRRPESCALHQDAGPPAGSTPLDRRIAWRDEATQPLAALRALALRDCRVNAWLRFGRAPILEDGRIYDLRFENPLGANFTSMAVGEAAVSPCPALVPPWGRPRADVLE
jgi:inner membrane protein